jgi:hypothetical protein
MHRRISVLYGNCIITQQIVYKWIERFEYGRTSVKHEEGAKCPSTSVTDANMELGHDMILQNRWVIIDEVAHQRQISHYSAYEIIHSRLALHKVCVRWVPEQLSELHKEKYLDICRQLVDGLLKVTTAWKESSREMKHGSTIMSQIVNILIHPPRKSSICIQLQEG